MGRRLILACMIVTMVTLIEAQRNIFQTSCPIGCADSNCYMGLGCTRCKPDWCRMYKRRLGFYCTLRCPRGMECMTKLGQPFCTRSRST